MKKRVLKKLDIEEDGVLPDNVVEVVSVVSVKLMGISNYKKLYKLHIWAVVEEDEDHEI